MLRNYLRGREVVAVRSKASGKRAAAATHLAGGGRRQPPAKNKDIVGGPVRALLQTTLS